MRSEQLATFAARGIVLDPIAEMLPDDWRSNPEAAFDAQPTLLTAGNAGIPAYLANLVDPNYIRVLVTPTKATQVLDEVKKGDWTTVSAQFPMVEATGIVASYGDYSNNGSTNSNYQWEPRQSYHFQTITQYGDRETEMWGLAQINYVSDLNYASALIMNKFQNLSYIFGISGLANYGMLNDPGLLPPITPLTKVAGGTSWSGALAYEIYNDFLALYTQLQTQLNGMIERSTPMTLVLSPIVEPKMGLVTAYTVASVREAILKEWPNMKIVAVPEYNTAAGEVMQLWVDEIDGQKTGWCAFTEKMRAGRVIADLSSFKQKKIGGTWGSVIRRPIAVAQMIGL